MKKIHTYGLAFSIIGMLLGCSRSSEESDLLLEQAYGVSGIAIDTNGDGIAGVEIFYTATARVVTDAQGRWSVGNLQGENTLIAVHPSYTFTPDRYLVREGSSLINFEGRPIIVPSEAQVYNWFVQQQLPNGLLESVENGNVISLYDNALAALVFTLFNDLDKAEKIFDYFKDRLLSELNLGNGGFYQFRDRNGLPSGNRWMGDNAWLLIALNNYKARTGSTAYNALALAISNWLISLQDTDGGLYAGYDSNDNLLNYKVTEGNIDAFNAIDGYTSLHSQLLSWLGNDRWDANTQSLVAWPGNSQYLYALDCHSWSYAIFPDYPEATLTSAERFLTTQTSTSGTVITGYCFDEDRDTVWPEGTGQMALAFGMAGMSWQKNNYLREMENVYQLSEVHPNAAGFPYASNTGTAYGADPLWAGADTKIAISGGAWYLFAKQNFNPFEVGRNKAIPTTDMFWLP